MEKFESGRGVDFHELVYIVEGYKVSLGAALTYLHELGNGGCWCEMREGNPMVSEHSKLCKEIKELLEIYPKSKEYRGIE